jgi:hypothetical protein
MNTNRISLISVTLLILGCLLVSGCGQSDSDTNTVTVTYKDDFDDVIADALHRTEVSHYAHIVERLRAGEYFMSKEEKLVAKIKQAVADSIVTWEELTLADSGELDQLHLKNQVSELKILVRELRTATFADKGTVLSVADDIRQGVTDGLVTWEDLGFSNPEQLSQLTQQMSPEQLSQLTQQMSIYETYLQQRCREVISSEAQKYDHQEILDNLADFQQAVNKHLDNVTITLIPASMENDS